MKGSSDISPEILQYIPLIREYIHSNYHSMYRASGEAMNYPFFTPGSADYPDQLWDWDSWWCNIALRQVLIELDDPAEYEKARPYERGCILNFLDYSGMDGWIPVYINRYGCEKPRNIYEYNMHKPCLAQHAAFLVRQDGGDAEWLRAPFYHLQTFINNYRNHHRHTCGLYYWQNDAHIGVDTDPCTYFRPPKSSGSIYLNCLMVRELEAMVYLCDCLNLHEPGRQYRRDADHLSASIREYCWDPWLRFYFSVDLNLVSIDQFETGQLHFGQPRDWPCLIQRIGVWSGFLALWAGVAGQEQAETIAAHYRDDRTFSSPSGVRSLSKLEKMYNLRASGNPSPWLGPVWGIANYMTWRGFLRYGLENESRDLAEKTIVLFGRDIQRFGAMHECYEPETGEPILNRGFQSWNLLVLNMINWLEGRPVIEE